MADPVLTIPVVLDLTQANQGIESLRKNASEGATFGAEGRRTSPGSSASPVERTARSYDRANDYSSLPQRTQSQFGTRVSVGGIPLPDENPTNLYSRESERHIIGRRTNQTRRESQAERWASGWEADAARDENRNESRFDRNRTAADLAAHKLGERNEAQAAEDARITAIQGTGSRARGHAMEFAEKDRQRGELKDADRLYRFAERLQRQDKTYREDPSAALNSAIFEGAEAESAAYPTPAAPGFAARNFPTFSKIASKTGALSGFYKRFLAIEGIRSVANTVQAGTDRDIARAGAQGSDEAFARADLQYAQQLQSSILPFGIGTLLGNGIEFAGNQQRDAAGAQGWAKFQDRQTGRQAEYGSYQLGLARAAQTAALPRGISRDSAAINADYAATMAKNREGYTAAASDEYNRYNQTRADIEANFDFHKIDANESAHRSTLAVLGKRYDATNSAAESLRNSQQKDLADNQAIAVQGNYATGAIGAFAAGGIRPSGPGALSPATQEAFARQGENVAAFSMRTQHKAAMDAQRIKDPSQMESLRAAQSGETAELGYNTTVNRSMRAAAQEQASRLMQNDIQGQRDMATAQIGNSVSMSANAAATHEMNRQLIMAQSSSDPVGAASAARTGFAGAMAVSGREIASRQLAITGNTAAVNSTIARNPDAVIADRYATAMGQAALAPVEYQRQLQAQAGSEAQLSGQRLADSRAGTGGRLALAEKTSGLLARAYGPGAQNFRDAAAVTGMAGSAELNAQDILRNDSTANGLAQADSARRTGLNNLGAFRANFMEGFSAREGSLNRTALSTDSSSRPEITLRAIQDAQDALRGNLGSNNVANVGGPAGTEAALLSQILGKLDNLVAGP